MLAKWVKSTLALTDTTVQNLLLQSVVQVLLTWEVPVQERGLVAAYLGSLDWRG